MKFLIFLIFFSTSIKFLTCEYADTNRDASNFNDWSKSRFAPKCIDIPSNMSLCQGIPYTKMMLPNLLNHETLTEAITQSQVWNQLVHQNCYSHTRLFLCTLFASFCSEEFKTPVKPCRRLCTETRNNCEPLMRRHSFKWPPILECDGFPVEKPGVVCMGPPDSDNKRVTVGKDNNSNRNRNDNRNRDRDRSKFTTEKSKNFDSDDDDDKRPTSKSNAKCNCEIDEKLSKKELCSAKFIIQTKIRKQGRILKTTKRKLLYGSSKYRKLKTHLKFDSRCNPDCRIDDNRPKILIGSIQTNNSNNKNKNDNIVEKFINYDRKIEWIKKLGKRRLRKMCGNGKIGKGNNGRKGNRKRNKERGRRI